MILSDDSIILSIIFFCIFFKSFDISITKYIANCNWIVIKHFTQKFSSYMKKIKIDHVTQSIIGHVTLIRHGHSKAHAASKEERRTNSSLVDCSMTVRLSSIDRIVRALEIRINHTEKRS